MKYIFLILLTAGTAHLWANEPIQPIPKTILYNHKKAKLGRLLFMDPMLSSDGTVSCHSCHDFDHGGADPRPVSIGVHGKPGNVNAPTVFNSYFNFRQFWNGRAKDLKDQAIGPLHNPVEMGMIPKKIETYISQNSYYNKLFHEVFHSEPTYEKALEAIAEFEKALITPNCRFDRYLRGEIELSDMEKKGFQLFKTLGCITCHNGINLGGNSYQKFGLIFPYAWKAEYPDRYAVTHDPKDKNVYKVPTLRNIALTAPYFHNGSAASLEDALRKMGHYNLGFKLEENEIAALKSFLNTLTGEKPSILREGRQGR